MSDVEWDGIPNCRSSISKGFTTDSRAGKLCHTLIMWQLSVVRGEGMGLRANPLLIGEFRSPPRHEGPGIALC